MGEMIGRLIDLLAGFALGLAWSSQVLGHVRQLRYWQKETPQVADCVDDRVLDTSGNQLRITVVNEAYPHSFEEEYPEALVQRLDDRLINHPEYIERQVLQMKKFHPDLVLIQPVVPYGYCQVKYDFARVAREKGVDVPIVFLTCLPQKVEQGAKEMGIPVFDTLAKPSLYVILNAVDIQT